MIYYPVSSRARFFSRLFNWARRTTRRFHLSETIRICRQLIHFGPWRYSIIALIQFFRGPAHWRPTDKSLMPELNARAIASALEANGVYKAGVLPQAFTDSMTHITDQLPAAEYHQSHEVSQHVAQIASDPAIINVVSEYLQCEPVLIESSIFVTNPETGKKPLSQNHFHYDYAGWQSLNVFVYLTDVSITSSHHVVIAGSHKRMSLRTLISGGVSDEHAYSSLYHHIMPITGKAGTVFFENVESLHKRTQGAERRVLLNLTFTSHRNLLSHGRAHPRQLKKRDAVFAEITKQASVKNPAADL